MAEKENTPLWLDLRKEYIDDNFDKLLVYLKDSSASGQKDSFYNTTINLLRQRVEDMLSSMAEEPVYETEGNRTKLLFNAKLLAAYLLVDGNHQLALSAYVGFMTSLADLNSTRISDMMLAATKRLKHEGVAGLGYGWNELDKVGTDLFAHFATKTVKFDKLLSKPLLLSKYGTAMLTKDGLCLTYEPLDKAKKLADAGAVSMDTGIGIMLKTSAQEKMKQSKVNDMLEMDEYVKNFIYQLATMQKKAPVKRLKHYAEGDEAVVKVVNIHAGTIYVETADTAYEKLSGKIVFEMTSLCYYFTDTLYQYLSVGDLLKVTIMDVDIPTFCFEDQLVDFFVNDTKETVGDDEDGVFLSKLIDEKPSFYVWLNECGIAMYTSNTGEYRHGQFAKLKLKRFGSGKQYGKIDGIIAEGTDESFDESGARHDCIRAFAESTAAPIAIQKEEETKTFSPVLLRLLIRLMFNYQKSLLQPSDRFRVLSDANIMAELVGDDLSASYINFTRTYLKALVQFVRDGDVKSIQLQPDEAYKNAVPTLVRLSVIELLKEYGRKDNSERLAKAISDFEDKLPSLARLARLVQTANSMQGILSDASLNVIRREIIKLLSMETENDADLEGDGKSYLGVESGTLEFKTSIIYPPNNKMQPDETRQNLSVLKGVCAFLNSTTGGTLYLGVNDQGYVTGLENDINYLKTTLDGYQRYVQDVIKRMLGIDSLPYIKIEPMYDDTVVAIRVEPHPYRVVELNNVAYLRVNAESRVMPENMKQQLIDRKLFTNKDKAAAVSRLQHACEMKKCVVLHNYASSNSGLVSDRHVEAYDVKPEDGLVICFDRGKQEVKVFSLSRIGYVEILDRPWEYSSLHKKVKVDVFHMTGDKTMQVSLQLDLMAKNLLVEEYPSAKDYISPNKSDENIWYFNAPVYQMAGIGRFYMGLANRIKILNAPELEQYVKDYCKKYLS